MFDDFDKQAGVAPEPRQETLKSLIFRKASDWVLEDTPEPNQIIENFLDVGDKLAIIASSKTRKSFYTLQFCACAAAGKSFCGLNILSPRRVVYIQFEIQENHLHRRLKRISSALQIEPSELENLHILNARGLGIEGVPGIERLKNEVLRFEPELIVCDPLYKLNTGTENDAKDTKTIMAAFDKLSTDTGAAVGYVHHDAKGAPGERQIQDRGAGSNVLGRDYDAAMVLSPHESEIGALVVECALRNYPPIEPFSIQWLYTDGGYYFNREYGLPPAKKTSKSKTTTPLEGYYQTAEAIIGTDEMDIKLFKAQFKEKTKLADSRIRDFMALMCDPKNPRILSSEERGRGKNIKKIRLACHEADLENLN